MFAFYLVVGMLARLRALQQELEDRVLRQTMALTKEIEERLRLQTELPTTNSTRVTCTLQAGDTTKENHVKKN